MGMLYTIQPEKEPFEFTHFDTWEFNQKQSIEEIMECQAREFIEVITDWEESLGICFNKPFIRQLGIENAFDLIIMQILEDDYDVFKGSDFIEIYMGESNE